MRPCPTCNAPNPLDKTVCYSCGNSLTAPPAHGQAPPAAQPYAQQPYPQQQYPQQPPPQQYAPQQQYAQQAYPPQGPAPSMPPGYVPQSSYPPQPYPQGYVQPPVSGIYPQQMAAAPNFNPAEVVRAAKIKEEYRTITRRLILAVLLAIGAGAAIAYAFKGQQTILGIPNMFWCCLPILGMVAFGYVICRCPGCKASLMMRNDVNETGECPFCGAQLK